MANKVKSLLSSYNYTSQIIAKQNGIRPLNQMYQLSIFKLFKVIQGTFIKDIIIKSNGTYLTRTSRDSHVHSAVLYPYKLWDVFDSSEGLVS